MPLQKILVPFLPGTQQRVPKDDDFSASKDCVLSPSLPFSPPLNSLHYGDPVIGLSTVDEDSSSTQSNDTTLENYEARDFNNEETCNLNADTYTPNNQNALVLRENPTSFELHDNDVIIESVPEVIEEGCYDQDMMRSSTTSLAMYQPPHIKAGIDFSPPAEFLAEEEDIVLTESPVNMAIPSTSPIKSCKSRTPPLSQELIEPPVADFIQPLEPIQNTCLSPTSEQPSHFAMETTFRKSESDFKSKCMKMIRNAKGLVCKPESPKNKRRTEKIAPPPQTMLRPIDTSVRETKDIKDEEASTPIYKRHHKAHHSFSNLPNGTAVTTPTTPYKSPVIGTDAYDIKLLCEQSFFGC